MEMRDESFTRSYRDVLNIIIKSSGKSSFGKQGPLHLPHIPAPAPNEHMPTKCSGGSVDN